MEIEGTPLGLGAWIPDGSPRTGAGALRDALGDLRRPVAIVSVSDRLAAATSGRAELGRRARAGEYPLHGWVPALLPDGLGDATFREHHGVRYAYVVGAMANAISSEELVEAAAKAGMLAFFGAAGASLSRISEAIDRLQSSLGDLPFGFNLIHSPGEPGVEADTVQLYLDRGIRTVSTSAYLGLTFPVVRYRVTDIHRAEDGTVVAPNRILAKVSRPSVARRFLEPPPQAMLDQLVEAGDLTAEQAALARSIPMADDLTAEADSGGHTDRRPLVVLLPELVALRDAVCEEYGYATPPRIGAAGGIATPASAAAAFGMGAAYIVTGSVNQACVESGSSDIVREMLAQAGPSDVGMAPAADMFEMGVELQVLTRGTMFAVRARKLYDLYKAHTSLDEMPDDDRRTLEEKYFRCSLDEAWSRCEAYWQQRDPGQVDKAASDPRHKLALLFRSYLGQSSRWANEGVADRRLDFQVWCGPSMGAFNDWARGSDLEAPLARTAVAVAHNILAGAAMLARVAALRSQGVVVPAEVERWRPLSGRDMAAFLERPASPRVTTPTPAVEPVDVPLSERDDAIAIVGMGCMFPSAADLGGFWQLVRTGADAVGDVPDGYWAPDDYWDDDPKAPDRTYAKRGAFLAPYDFDPTEFGIPPNILEATDTCQLLALVVAKQALRDAGYDPDGEWDRGRTSVMLGITGTQELVVSLGARLGHPHWWRALRDAGVDDDTAGAVVDGIGRAYPQWQESSFPGLLGNVVAGRIANRFDLGGTNCVLDAACASSLAAMHLACLELATGRADMVLTGGADTLNDIFMHMCFSKTPALSPTGDARPFSASADGTILGEGLGMVVLKRLADAERDGDRVYAVLRGLGTSSDGRAKSIYAPRPAGQARALRDACDVAAVSPATVELVEAHGTGTKAGDLCEFEALQDVYREAGDGVGWCALGSVKSQIGHAKAAAGAAGLIKAALALHHKVIPPTIKVDAPNPKFDVPSSPFYLPREARPWVGRASHPRRAGVSSFGFGGSDYHVVLEEYRRERAEPAWDGSVELIPLCADDPTGLLAALDDLAEGPLAHAGSRARAVFRSQAAHRLVLVVEGGDLASVVDAARRGLAERPDVPWSGRGVLHGVGPSEGRVGFLFPGQGSQYPGMLGDLAVMFPELLDALSEEPALAERIFPVPTFDPEVASQARAALTATDVAQPSLGLVEAALIRILARFGVRPDAVAGHSYGELSALHAAGRLDRAELLSLSRVRGSLMAGDGEDRGTMLAVLAPLSDVDALIEDRGLDVVLANRNTPSQAVLSGAQAAIDAAETACEAAGLRTRRLDVGAAFHSPLVADARAGLREALSDYDLPAGTASVFACATASEYPDGADAARDLLADQLASPVRFVELIDGMYAAGVRTFVEVGPKAALTSMVGRILGDRPHTALAADASSGRRGLRDLAMVLARLAADGRDIDLRPWQDVPLTPVRTPRMVVPLAGANHRSQPRPAPSVRRPSSLPPAPPKPARPTPAASVPEPSMSSDDPNPSVPADPTVLGQALHAAHSTLAALQAMQEQTALIHQQFLQGQQAAQQNLQALIAGQQRLVERALGGNPADLPAIPLVAAPVTVPQPSPLVAPAVIAPVPLAPVVVTPDVPTPPVAAAPPTSPAVELVPTLLAVVSESTGYPVDMIDLDMDMESDLGIDSIKRVEILSLFTDRMPGVPQVEPEALGRLRTLRQVAEFVGGASSVQDSAPKDTKEREGHEGAASVQDAHSVGVQQNQVVPTLLAVVSESTGYPPEMIDLDMDMESDLGIDSIKRVEILSLFTERMPGAPQVEPEELGRLRTLRQVAEFVGASSAQGSSLSVSQEAPVPDTARPVAALGRWELRARAAGALASGVVKLSNPWVVDDGTGFARALADVLSARLVNRAESNGGLPEGACEALILTAGTDAPVPALKEAFLLVQALAPRLREAGGVLVSVTRMDGRFGLGDDAWTAEPLQGALAGLLKTAAREFPEVRCRALDVAPDMTDDAAAQAVAAELGSGGPVEVGITGAGRFVLDLVPHTTSPRERSIDDGVVVVTGGARGVTAACAIALAEQTGARLLLLGRSSPPDIEPSWLADAATDAEVKRALLANAFADQRPSPRALGEACRRALADREIRATLAALQSAGSPAVYRSVDVRDAAAVSAAIAYARAEMGPVRGLVHGAGVLRDRRIQDKTAEQFDAVFDTKVLGLQALLAATADDDLRFVCCFTSVSGRFGRKGQVDYAMANEALARTMAREASLRPEVRCVALDWGPWEGGMVTPALKTAFEREGVGLIPMRAGALHFVDEVLGGGPTEVLVGAGLEASVAQTTAHATTEHLDLDPETHLYLSDHKLAGKPVVPMAMMLEWFAAAATKASPGRVVLAVEDLKVLQGMVLDDGPIGAAVALTWEGDRYTAELHDSDGRVRASATVLVGDRDDAPAAHRTEAQLDASPLSIDEAYSRRLFHGDRFRAIQRIGGVTEQSMAASLRAAPERGEWIRGERGGWTTDPLAVDGALQSMILWCWERRGSPCLPNRVGRYLQFRDSWPKGGVLANFMVRASEGANVDFDVDLVDDEGDLVARMEGVRCTVSPSLVPAFGVGPSNGGGPLEIPTA